MAAKKGERLGGRQKGTPNKRTTEMIERARIDIENAARSVPRSRVEGTRRLGKDVLDEFMHMFAGLAAKHQPIEGPVPAGRVPNEAKFLTYAKLAVDTARALAEFQSPKFKAMMVVAPEVEAPAKQVEGNVVRLNDPVALARVYNQLIKQVG